MVLVKNKHSLNVIIMKNYFPELNDLRDETIYAIFKKLISLDRVVRSAKEELRDDNQISLDDDEQLLLKILQQEVQLSLGYEAGFNDKRFKIR